MTLRRCSWAGTEPNYVAYHDREWGVPVRDDRVLFEFLVLEGAQAGLSWATILRKRENYRTALDGFDAACIARYDERKLNALMQDPGIVRNRLKIASLPANARSFLEVQAQHGSFANYLWAFVDGKPIQNLWASTAEVPATTPLSDAVSRELKRRGFKFVGSTVIYAYLQAVGLVNDHFTHCFRHREIAAAHGARPA